MSRACILATNAYPFLMRYWYELFVNYWEDEVDKVYIAISNPEHKSSWLNTRKLLNSHPKIEVIETGLKWPFSLNEVAKNVKEDYLFIPHDDSLIFKKGIVDGYFKLIEADSNLVVTPVTNIFNPLDLMSELMLRKYPKQVPFVVPETGESAYSFYCNMFFIGRELLHKTSIDFGEFHCPKGEYCELLDWTPIRGGFDADTNYLLCLELLRAGAEFRAIPRIEIAQLYNMPDPLDALDEMVENKKPPFDGSGWLHLQTMAYHIYGLYFDVGEREALIKQQGGNVKRKIHNNEIFFENPSFIWSHIMKIALIEEFMSVGNYSGIQKYYTHAKNELAYIKKVCKLDQKAIDKFRKVFHKLMWLHE